MQVQFIQLAQWMSGFAASIIAGTSIFMPNFAVQKSDDAAEQPKKKEHRIVRRVETNGRINDDIDELLKKYNIDLHDSNGVQSFSFSDDSSSAEIIIIDQEMLDGTVLMADSLVRIHTLVSDSLIRLQMPRFDSAMSNYRFDFKRFDKDFRKTWKPQMDSLRKGQKFAFKNFNKVWKSNMDSVMKNQTFIFKNLEGLDSTMQHFEFNMQGLDSALQHIEIDVEGIEPQFHFSVPDDSTFGSNTIIRTLPRRRNVAIMNGKAVKRNGKTRVFMRNNYCGDSLKTCKERILIHGDMPMPPHAPLPPDGVMLAVPPVPRIAVAPFPHMTKNARVVIIKKKGSKRENKKVAEPKQEQIAAVAEETPIDRGRYLPEEYTEANPWNLNLSPNPTNGIVNISCEMPLKDIPVKVGIYDIQGNQVFVKEGISPVEFQNMQLDLSANPTGIYFIQISQGERAFTAKFEIQK